MDNWSAHKAFEKATSNPSPAHETTPIIQIYDEGDTIPLEAWEDALIKSAKLVDRFGEKYLPIFERVECELENARHQLRLLAKAQRIANGNLSLLNNSLRQQSYFIEP